MSLAQLTFKQSIHLKKKKARVRNGAEILLRTLSRALSVAEGKGEVDVKDWSDSPALPRCSFAEGTRPKHSLWLPCSQ